MAETEDNSVGLRNAVFEVSFSSISFFSTAAEVANGEPAAMRHPRFPSGGLWGAGQGNKQILKHETHPDPSQSKKFAWASSVGFFL